MTRNYIKRRVISQIRETLAALHYFSCRDKFHFHLCFEAQVNCDHINDGLILTVKKLINFCSNNRDHFSKQCLKDIHFNNYNKMTIDGNTCA